MKTMRTARVPARRTAKPARGKVGMARRPPSGLVSRRTKVIQRPGTRPGRPARTGRMAAGVILAALLVAAFWLWPEVPQAQIEAKTPPPREVAAEMHAAPRRRPPPAPRPAPPVPPPGVDEAQLRAAVVSRAPDLRACALPAGSPPQIPVRLRLASAGVPKLVELSSPEPIPSTLAGCLRERMLAWRFADLRLRSDVDVQVTFALR